MYLQVDGSNARIAGTMHVFPAESPDMPQWLWQAYDRAEDLVIESDPPSILPHRQLADGSQLADHLPANVLHKLSQIWPENFGPVHALKPWAAFLSAPLALLPHTAGVEMHIIERAKQDSKPVYTLETGADVAALFDSLPTNLFAERLEFIVSNPDTARATFRAVHVAWLSRSIPALLRSVASLPLFAIPALRSAILLTRNRAWMSHFRVGIQAQRRTLFLVGALHLCGDGSVPELIQQEGHGLSTLE